MASEAPNPKFPHHFDPRSVIKQQHSGDTDSSDDNAPRTAVTSGRRTKITADSHRSPLPASHSASLRRASISTARRSPSPEIRISGAHSAHSRLARTTPDHKARRTSDTPITASSRRSAISAPYHHRSTKVKGDQCGTSCEGHQRSSKVRRNIFCAEVVAAPEVKGDQRTLHPAQVISVPEAGRQYYSYMARGWVQPVDIPLPPWPDRLSVQYSSYKRSKYIEETKKFPEFAVLDENVISVWHAYYKSVHLTEDQKDQLSGNLADHMYGKDSVGITLNKLIDDPERRKEELGEFLKLLGMLYALTMDKKEFDFEIELRRYLNFEVQC